MKPFRVASFLGLVAVVCAQAPETNGVVEGTVINTATGVGVDGATVTLGAFAGPKPRYETTTDAAGRFRIADLPPGMYRPAAEKDGFGTQVLSLRAALDSAVSVTGPDPLRLDLKLTPLNTVRGRVVLPDGTPAAGIEVGLIPNIFGTVTTDAEGRFAVEDIRPGSYLLVAKPSHSASVEEAADGTRTAMVRTYFPARTDRSLAQPIELRGLPEYGDFEIRMQTAPVYRIRGVVLDEEGKPSPGTWLSLNSIPTETPEPMQLAVISRTAATFALGVRRRFIGTSEVEVKTGDDGRFVFPTVPSGDWRINVEWEAVVRGAVSASIRRADLEDLEIRLASLLNGKAQIEWAPGTPPVESPLFLVNAETSEFVRSGIVNAGELRLDGLLPGRYRIVANPGLVARTFLGAAMTGDLSLTADGPPLRIVLQRQAGSVRGTVDRGEGSTVLLVPQRVDGIAIGQTVAAGAGGAFEFAQVSPGDYYVIAVGQLDGFTPSAAILSLMPSRGTSVKVQESSTATVTLSVTAAR